jgi:hypothetical protein
MPELPGAMLISLIRIGLPFFLSASDRVRLPESEAEPSLSEMSSVALKTLDRAAATDSKKGFLLLVEGSRIDMAAHSNDPANHARDILEYQETVTVVSESLGSKFCLCVSLGRETELTFGCGSPRVIRKMD